MEDGCRTVGKFLGSEVAVRCTAPIPHRKIIYLSGTSLDQPKLCEMVITMTHAGRAGQAIIRY